MVKKMSKNKNFWGRRRARENLFGWVLLSWTVVMFLFNMIFVNFGSIIMAFQTIDKLGNRTWAGFDNFASFVKQAISKDSTLGLAVINSAKMYIINFVICNPLYFIFSFYIFKNYLGSKTFRKIMMVPSMVSSMIMALVFKMFVEGGLPTLYAFFTGNSAETFPNLFVDVRYVFGTSLFYMIWTSFYMALILYPNAMNAIDTGIFEAARIDGAGQWTEFWSIAFPLIWPTISTNLVLGVADFFTNSGVSVIFYKFAAPVQVQTVGYFFTATVMNDKGEQSYPMLAAGGMVLTAITTPAVLLVKHLLEKYGPSED